MLVFVVILAVALALVYVNLRALARGKWGHTIAVAVLLALIMGMVFRETFVGSLAVAFFAVWLSNAFLFFIPWTLYRIAYYFTQPHHLSHRKVHRVSRVLLVLSILMTAGIMAYGIPHNQDYKTNLISIDLPSQYTEEFTAVYFSDIHIDPLFRQEKLERFVAQVDSIKPDYVLFGGDLADVPMEKLDAWGYEGIFKRLTAAAKVVAYAVNGNHESMIGSAGETPEAWMRKVGFVVLDDSTSCEGPACFTGRTDYMVASRRGVARTHLSELIPDTVLARRARALEAARLDSIARAVADSVAAAKAALALDSLQADSVKTAAPSKSVKPVAAKVAAGNAAEPNAVIAADSAVSEVLPAKPLPWILLDHQPKGVELENMGRLPEMALSGHTHDGQFFPVTLLINHVWKLAYGKGALAGVLWLVSSGFDCWGPPVRFGSDSEIWVIKYKVREKNGPAEETAESAAASAKTSVSEKKR